MNKREAHILQICFICGFLLVAIALVQSPIEVSYSKPANEAIPTPSVGQAISVGSQDGGPHSTYILNRQYLPFVCKLQRQSSPFSLAISLPKERFSLDEPVPVTVRLTNISVNSFYVNELDFLDGFLRFEIISPQGTVLPRISPVLPGIPKVILLESGQSIETTIDISHYFELTETGQYCLKAIFQSRINYKGYEPFWEGALESNSLIFSLADC